MTQRDDPQRVDFIGCSPHMRELVFFLRECFCRGFQPSPKATGNREHRPWSPSGHSSQENPAGVPTANSSTESTEAPRVPTSASFRGSGAEDRIKHTGDTQSLCPVPRKVPLCKYFSFSTQVSQFLRGNPNHLSLGIHEPRTPSSGEV